MPTASGGDPAASFLGPSEPNWSKVVEARRLSGLLNLSSLLSKITLISDNDVSDNVHFLESFRSRERLGLYQRLQGLVEIGAVRLLMRDQLYRPNSETTIDSFTDIYESWLAHDPVDAWIVQEFTESRRAYFLDLDRWVAPNDIVRYPYRTMKLHFMENVRKASASENAGPFSVAIRRLPTAVRSEYDSLLTREWFSLTDVNTLFQSRGIPWNHPAMLYQGLMNQMTFSAHSGAALVGAEAPDLPAEAVLWPSTHNARSRRQRLTRVAVEEILERADAVLDGPSLSVLAVLSPEEIGTLRAVGEPYFALLDLAGDPLFWAREHGQFGAQFVRAAVNYWGQVCDYIRSKYSPVIEQPTRLAILLGYDPDQRTLPMSALSVAVEAGIGASTVTVPGIGGASNAAAKAVLRLVKLRFLFLAKTEEFRRIERVLPRSAWFRRARPEVTAQRSSGRIPSATSGTSDSSDPPQ
jgi:hypothetical protein